MSTEPCRDLSITDEQAIARWLGSWQLDFIFYRTDAKGLLTYISPASEPILGYSPEQLLGRTWQEFFGEPIEGQVSPAEEIRQFTVEVQHASGETRLLEVQEHVTLGPEGKYLSREGVAKDITQVSRTAEELEQLQENFEKLVAQRISDLKFAADTIREKETHLAHVSRLATMGELVAGIAHEVHQPLHAAKTFAEAARRNLEAGLPKGITTAIDCTKEISEAINRTAKIIRHLRTFTTAKPVKFESLSVNEVVQGAAEIISYETRRSGVRVEFRLAAKPLLIQGDQVQLEQACVNLLMNAYEAMIKTPLDQREVVVSTCLKGQNVEITFSDRGCGVDAKEQDKMFVAFYSTKPNGMGMGLSLCRSIAEAHSGEISSRRNEGLGMTLTFTLPLSRTASDKICHE